MIKQDAFQLWRFCTTDGVLDEIKSVGLYDTKFVNGSIIHYDPDNELVTITNNNKIDGEIITMTFRECTLDKLKELGFRERSFFRHELSRTKFNIHFTK